MAKINWAETDLRKGSDVYDAFSTLTEQRRVRDIRDLFELTFTQYFSHSGYSGVEGIPLISDRDDSVLLTGASISAVKDRLLTGDFPQGSNGVYIAQECLRTNALKYAFENTWIPYGQMYFKMVTILSRPGRFDEVLEEALDFTENALGVDKSRIRIRSTKERDKLNDVEKRTDVPVDYDTKPPSYYHWDYGIEGVHGDGLTICIYNPATGKWFDIGNIVLIYDDSGTELGIEFGYGYEFALTAIVGVDQALRFSRIYELFEFVPGLLQKYYSTIEAVTMMRIAGAQLGDRGVDHVYKQYLKSLEYMAVNLDRDIEDVIDIMRAYGSFIDYPLVDLQKECEFMYEHRNRKKRFAHIIKRVGAYLWAVSKGRMPKEFIQDPERMIRDYLTMNGIRVVEVLPQLERLKRFNLAILED